VFQEEAERVDCFRSLKEGLEKRSENPDNVEKLAED
jgi:hypothetical protein